MLVKIKSYTNVEVTDENEFDILESEFERRYSERKFYEGESVVIVANGRQKHIDAFGEDHVGKRAIVVGLGPDDSVKLLAISRHGEFVEVWAAEWMLEAVDAGAEAAPF